MAKKSKYIRSRVIYKTKSAMNKKINSFVKFYGYRYYTRKVKGGYRLYVNRADMDELPF